MSYLFSIAMGFLQGVAEFLPISSSGHLAIAQELLGFGVEGSDDMFFDVLLHLGTLAAVFVAYWADIKEMILEFIRTIQDVSHGGMPEKIPPARRMILLVVVGTLPLFLVLPIQDFVEGLSSNTYFIGAALLVTGVLLWVCDRVKKGRKNERTATMRDVLVVGLSQAVATCPGLSRSGTTISVGCFVGFERKFAVRYAFLLSIPAVLGANLLHFVDVIQAGGIDPALVPAYLLGVAVAAVSGYFSIRLLRFVAEKGRFGAFSYYCWAAGVITLALSVMKSTSGLPWLGA